MTSSQQWATYYLSHNNSKPLIPESFVARCFLSQRPVAMLDDYDFHNKTLLDIGCGNGRHIDFFHRLGFKTTGLEVSTQKVETLKQQFPLSSFAVGTSSQLPFLENAFDYVVAINSIYYLDADDTLLNNIRACSKVLKPGGTLFISLIASDHFAFKDAQTLNMHYHQCDNGIKMQPVASKTEIKELIEPIENLTLKKLGELQDELDDLNRHLYYLTLEKTG